MVASDFAMLGVPHRLVLGLLLFFALLVGAQAAEHRYWLLLDRDANPGTGCTQATVNGAVPGIDLRFQLTVNTTTSAAVVSRLEQSVCTGSSFAAATLIENGPWPAGLGIGGNGFAVLEAAVPRGVLPTTGTSTAWAMSDNGSGGQDATTAFAIAWAEVNALPVPLSPALAGLLSLALALAAAVFYRRHPQGLRTLVLLVAVGASGLVLAATIVRDGQISDWLGISAAVLDPAGDAPPNADISAAFWTRDTSFFYFRIDADVRLEASNNQAPQANAGPNQTITLPALVNLTGSASDDGLPNPPGALSFAWSTVNGPGVVTFGNPAAASTTASFAAAGVYVLRLTVDDGALAAYADTSINVGAGDPQVGPLADRSLPLGSSLSMMVRGSDPDANQTLAFSLSTGPTGATITNAGRLIWTPQASQLGPNAITVRAQNTAGRSATGSFVVTVTPANRPPVLAPQADAQIVQGTSFSRALTATDPDPGDSLSYSLVTAPAGLSLAGSLLNWPTSGVPLGAYVVVVQVADAGGFTHQRSFSVQVLPGTPPVARNDRYEIPLGQTLGVAPAGVLANDVDPLGQTLAASKLSDPDKGTLSAFGVDGGFTYQAPASTTEPPLDVKAKWLGYGPWQAIVDGMDLLAGDLDGDGRSELISFVYNDGILAIKGPNPPGQPNPEMLIEHYGGFSSGPAQNCSPLRANGKRALADIDDDGQVEIIVPVNCLYDQQVWPSGPFAMWDSFDRVAALAYDASAPTKLAVKWLSPPLSQQLPRTPPATGTYSPISVANEVIFSVARLAPGESPSILFGVDFQGQSTSQCQHAGAGSNLKNCRLVWALDGSDGSVRHRFVYLPAEQATEIDGWRGTAPPVVTDLEGDGSLELLFRGTIWNVADQSVRLSLDGTAANRPFWDSTLIDLDADGLPELLAYSVLPNYEPAFVRAFRLDGTRVWNTEINRTSYPSRLNVADLDRDGSPDILFEVYGTIYALDARGRFKWLHRVPPTSPWWEQTAGQSRLPVYDLNGDGILEVIVQDGKNDLLFLRGDNGALQTRWSYPGTYRTSTNQWILNPLVADLDGDGHAEVAFLHEVNVNQTNYFVVLEGDANPWRAAGRWVNQIDFNGTQIDAAGTVPPVPLRYWTDPATNQARQQPTLPYTVDPKLRTQTQFTYQTTAAGRDSAPATVTIDILPQNRAPIVTSTPPTSAPGTYSLWTYQVLAFDPDPGNTISFDLIANTCFNSANIWVDANTGLLSVNQQLGSSVHVCILGIRITDNHGATTDHIFSTTFSDQWRSVPDLTGLDFLPAQGAILAADLQVGKVVRVDSSAPPGQIVGQTPAAGTSLRLQSAVDLLVSQGPAPQIVPFVVGQAQNPALAQLSGLGFATQLTYVYSNTVPADIVVSQTPAAGTSLVPIPAHPVALEISAGNGLRLSLNRTVTTAGQSIAYSLLAFDLAGNSVAPPSMNYQVVPRRTPYLGALPGAAAGSISTVMATLGAFTLLGTEVGGAGRSVAAHFSVLPPADSDPQFANHGTAFARLATALEAIYALKAPMQAALDASDTTQMRGLLGQMVTIWRTVDLEDLRLSLPLAPASGFPPTPASLSALSIGPTASDDYARVTLAETNAAMRAWIAALRTPGTPLATLQALGDDFNTRAAQLAVVEISQFGGAASQAGYATLVSHLIPAFFEAVSEDLAVHAGLPPRTPRYPFQKATGDKTGNSAAAKSSLAELAVTQATAWVVDKIMSQASELYSNAKETVTQVLANAAYTTAVAATASTLRAILPQNDLVEVVSGASLSFREFQQSPAWLEAPGAAEEPEAMVVTMIGPDLFQSTFTAATNFVNTLQEGYSKNLDPNNNPNRFKNLGEIKKTFTQFKQAVDQAFSDLNKHVQAQAGRVFQTPTGVLYGCVFSSDPGCRQLLYEQGIEPLYFAASGPGGLSAGIPVPILFFVFNTADGAMYFATPNFLPCMTETVAGQTQASCPNNPPFNL